MASGTVGPGSERAAGSEAQSGSYCQLISALKRCWGWAGGCRMHVRSHAWVPPELTGRARSAFPGIYLPLFLSPCAQPGAWVQLVRLFLIPISQAGLWSTAVSRPSSPMCMKSCESAAGADKAKGFFGFLLPPLPSTAPRLFFSCGFDNMFI